MQEKIISFLKDREAINILAIERATGMPLSSLHRCVKKGLNIPKKHIPNLVKELQRYGFESKETEMLKLLVFLSENVDMSAYAHEKINDLLEKVKN